MLGVGKIYISVTAVQIALHRPMFVNELISSVLTYLNMKKFL